MGCKTISYKNATDACEINERHFNTLKMFNNVFLFWVRRLFHFKKKIETIFSDEHIFMYWAISAIRLAVVCVYIVNHISEDQLKIKRARNKYLIDFSLNSISLSIQEQIPRNVCLWWDSPNINVKIWKSMWESKKQKKILYSIRCVKWALIYKY